MEKIADKNSKQRILEAATKLFAQNGFDAVSTRKICKKASVNLCMISYYFGGKQELYDAIIDDLIEKHTQYAKTFMDISVNPKNLTKQEQINMLLTMLDKFIDFFYSNISSDLIILMLKEQQNPNFTLNSPVFDYLRKVVACVFNKDENSKEAIYKTLFIISQINSPKIFPAFSLRLLGQDTFTQEDIKIIRNNIIFYINLMLKEEGIV